MGSPIKEGNRLWCILCIVHSILKNQPKNSLFKLDAETRGVLYHELTHAYQQDLKISVVMGRIKLFGLVLKAWRMP